MAREMMYGDAIAAAIIEEMQRDPDVVFYGQNMAMTERDPMLKKFGKDRVRLAPISETAEIGIGIGAAMTGLRPIVELWMSEFMLVAFDQVINEAPRFHYMSGGQVKVPVLMMTAQDDPFVPYDVFQRARVSENPLVRFVAPKHGGHCGFISKWEGAERFWAEERIAEFCQEEAMK